MAGNWYRDEDRGGGNEWRGGDRDRSSSIFGDEHGRSGHSTSQYGSHSGDGDDRGFFERAGEELRSWFGGDGSEDQGERGYREQDRSEPWGGGDWAQGPGRGASSGGGQHSPSHYGPEHGFGGFQGDYEGGRGQGGFGGQGDYRGGRQSFSSGGSQRHGGGFGPHDDHYRSWRDRQIAEMDREYEEYCRERQQSFHNDFDSWRQVRRSQASAGTGFGASASTGSSGLAGGSDAGPGPSPVSAILGAAEESEAAAGGGTGQTADTAGGSGRGKS